MKRSLTILLSLVVASGVAFSDGPISFPTGGGGSSGGSFSGTATAVQDNLIVNADVNSSAAIDATKIGAGGVTSTEFGYIGGLTSDAQTQMNLKAPLAGPTFTGTVTIPTPFTLGAVSVLPTGTELNYVDGVTSSIQTQLNVKGDFSGPGLSTDNAVVLFNGTSGKTGKNSPCTVGTDNAMACTGGFSTAQSASTAGSVKLYELSGNGASYIEVKSPDALAGNVTLTLPNAAAGGTNYLLNFDADGTGGFTDPATFAAVGQTFYIGTTQMAINRSSAGQTIAGLTLTTPELGSGTATTQSAGDNSTKVATTAYVDAAVITGGAGSFSFGWDNASVTDNTFLWKVPAAITITQVDCLASTDNVVGHLTECTAANKTSCTVVDSSDWTVTNANSGFTVASGFENAGITAGNWLKWETASIAGASGDSKFNCTVLYQ